jgi:hypothetical protein
MAAFEILVLREWQPLRTAPCVLLRVVEVALYSLTQQHGAAPLRQDHINV